MNPMKMYRQRNQSNWTRIEMLLALYRETENSICASVDALQADDQSTFLLHQVKTIKLLLAIIDGIDEKQDKLSSNVYHLCLFIFDQVSQESLNGLENGLRVLVTLKESFEAIETEARQLEAEGTIPPLDFDLDGTLAVG